LPSLAGQAVGDVAQAVDRVQLAEQHRHEQAQQVNPLALRSASCLRTAASKSARGISFKTWEKMLHTVDKVASFSDGQVLDKPNLSDR
jgi:hypothetical protein